MLEILLQTSRKTDDLIVWLRAVRSEKRSGQCGCYAKKKIKVVHYDDLDINALRNVSVTCVCCSLAVVTMIYFREGMPGTGR